MKNKWGKWGKWLNKQMKKGYSIVFIKDKLVNVNIGARCIETGEVKYYDEYDKPVQGR